MLCSVCIFAQNLKTEVIKYGPNIVRVVKYPASLSKMPEKESFSVIMRPQESAQMSFSWTIGNNGEITFTDKQGNVLLKTGAAEVTPITEGVDKGFYTAKQTFLLDADEAIFGLGQRNDPDLNQSGKQVRIWSTNGNITIPYFTSEKGYGVYWDNAGLSYFNDRGNAASARGNQGRRTRTGAIQQPSENSRTTEFSSEVSSGVDFYFMYKDGTQDGVMESVRALSGQATMFPLWTLGFWQCRERYKSSDELCEVVDMHRKLGIPLDGIVQDWQYWGCDSNWNAMKFLNPHYINKMGDPEYMRYLPDGEDKNARYPEPRIKSPQEMVDYVHQQNAHLMISIWASFGPWTDQYKELEKIGALYPFDTWPRNKGVLPYDPFNPKARDIYWKYLKNLYDMNIDAWWSDSTEPDQWDKPGDMEHMTYSGSWKSVKNAFPLLTNLGIYEHQRKAKGGNNKRAFQMTRCGAFGLQRTGAFNWSGDITSNWATFKSQIPSGLNHTLCGNAFWNTDLGGFFYWEYEQNAKNPALAELQTRWMQWGTFMPLMRNHCSSPMISEIYLYGEKGDWAYDAQVEAVKLRYRILPYSYSQAGACVQRSETMMRPFVFDFPKDKTAINNTEEYMYGHSILVRPVTDPLYTFKGEGNRGKLIYPDVKQAGAPVNVYLPQGCIWYDFWTNQKYEGGKTIEKVAPINIIPLYVKAGSIIPFGPDVQYSNEKKWDNLEIRIYPGADADYILYEDEGDNYNYEKGAFTQIKFHWDDKAHILTIADREGKYNGMLTTRQFNIVVVGAKTPSGAEPAQGKEIQYNGKKVTVDLSAVLPINKETLQDPSKYKEITTEFIVNPSFEADGTTLTKQTPKGWTVAAKTNWWGINQGGKRGDPKATDGQFLFGVWDDAVQDASIYQTIKNLQAGKYVLTVDMHASNSGTTVRVGDQALFAGNEKVLFADQITNPGSTDEAPMQMMAVEFNKQNDEDIRIGVSTGNAPSATWFKIDNFHLYKAIK